MKKMNEQDVGAALMAWYADCIKQFPEGLVTQSQAAVMLGISRVAVNRLITRGHLRAVYFPKPPDIEGMGFGYDDPTWTKILGWFDNWADPKAFPKAVYVSFDDVMRLWKSGTAKEKCRIDWLSVLVNTLVPPSEEARNIEHYASKANSELDLQQKKKPTDKESK